MEGPSWVWDLKDFRIESLGGEDSRGARRRRDSARGF